MRLIEWLRGHRLDDELDGDVVELFTQASAPARLDAARHARARAQLGAAIDPTSSGSPIPQTGFTLFGVGSMLASIWGVTASHRVAAAVAGGAILLGSGMVAEASGVGPTVREAVLDVVQGQGEDPQSEAITQNENATDGAIVEPNDEITGSLITHVGGSGHLHMRAILTDFTDPTLELVVAGDNYESIDLAPDARIIIPGPPSELSALDRLPALATERPVLIVEGVCVDGLCFATRVIVLRDAPGKPDGVGGGPPEGVGSGQPEGVGQGSAETPGKSGSAGKPEGAGPPENE